MSQPETVAQPSPNCSRLYPVFGARPFTGRASSATIALRLDPRGLAAAAVASARVVRAGRGVGVEVLLAVAMAVVAFAACSADFCSGSDESVPMMMRTTKSARIPSPH